MSHVGCISHLGSSRWAWTHGRGRCLQVPCRRPRGSHRAQRADTARARGQDAAYDRVPCFYTDQYDLGMEYAGYAEPGGYDAVVVRGDPGRREFIAFWMSEGRVIAGMNVNVWDVTDQIQALVRSGKTADPARLADPAVPLEETIVSAP